MSRTLEDTLVFDEIEVAGYEKVLKITDDQVGLKAIISLHNTKLGPTLGGTRIYPYPTFDAALTDVLRLSKGMTYKSALAETGFGGGKSVIIRDPKHKTPELLASFAQAVNRLGGAYICAEDSGCTLDDATTISKYTPYVVGVRHEKSSGNPSPFTAWGVFRGIQSALKKVYGSDSVEGKTIAIQGIGSVGLFLAERLFWHGAKLILSDIDWDKTVAYAKQFGAQACPAEDILSVKCDVLAPCAMGGILNSQTIPQIQCKIVAGAANNQLLTDQDGDELTRRGILYAPDFVINAGGLINVAQETELEGYNPTLARLKTDKLYDQLMQIYDIAEQNCCSTHQAAVSLGDHRLKYGIGKRQNSPSHHHFNGKSK